MDPNQGPEQCRLEGPQGQLSIEDTAGSSFLSKAVTLFPIGPLQIEEG